MSLNPGIIVVADGLRYLRHDGTIIGPVVSNGHGHWTLTPGTEPEPLAIDSSRITAVFPACGVTL